MIENNNVAFIIEGGGLRGSYLAGLLGVLLDNDIHFNYVCGISAGSSLLVNYIVKDKIRARKCFVDFVLDDNKGGWLSWLQGKGFFNSDYIYGKMSLPDGTLPLDYDKFVNSNITYKIGTVDKHSGEAVYFGNDDVDSLTDLMDVVRASSSLPLLMNETVFKGQTFVDGGVAGGVALDIAQKDGYNKFFVFLSREKGYRKKPSKIAPIINIAYRNNPKLRDAINTRYIRYNATLDQLEQLESEGKAYLVYPDSMPVSSNELNYDKVFASYTLGIEQGLRDVEKWKQFLRF